MTLRDALNAVPLSVAELSQQLATLDVVGISHDSRSVGPGELFVALSGAHVDGRQHAAAAVARGAVAVLAEGEPEALASLAAGAQLPWIRTSEDPRPWLGPLAAEIYGHPDRELTLVGITGTNGKSTVAALCAAMLEAAGRPAGVLGTLGYRFANRDFSREGWGTGRTTPEATDLFRMLRAMRAAGAEAAAMEVSSIGLDQGRVHGATFDVAVFTNLTHDHLDYHGDFERYFAAKQRLFEQLKAGGTAVVHLGDAWGRRLRDMLQQQGTRVLTYGVAAELGADVTIEDADMTVQGSRGRLRTPRGDHDFEGQLVGSFNLENLLAALAVAEALELDTSPVLQAIATFPPVPGRLELVTPPGQAPPAFVDYAHTPAALEAALRALRELAETPFGRRPVVVVFGCGGDRDRDKRVPMGRIAGELSELPIATNDNPRGEDPQRILAQVEEGLEASGNPHYLVEPDRRRAIRLAIELAPPEALVLVAGKGHEATQDIGGVKTPFSDHAELCGALAAVAARTAATSAAAESSSQPPSHQEEV